MISTCAAAFAALAIAGFATPGFAAPAQAGTDVCRASAPAAGASVEGAVLHVADDQSVCLAQGPTPDEWIPLVIEGPSPVDRHDPMLTKAALMSAVFGKRLECRVTSVEGGVARAACSVGREPVGRVLATVTRSQAMAWAPHPES